MPTSFFLDEVNDFSVSEFQFGLAVQKWWSGLASGLEGCVGAVKQDDDETHVELFRQICDDVQKKEQEVADARKKKQAAEEDATARK